MTSDNDTLDGLPNWVCMPDDDASHLTTYYEGEIGGCEQHTLAGGCSIPQEDLKALILSKQIEELEAIRGGKPMSWGEAYSRIDNRIETLKKRMEK